MQQASILYTVIELEQVFREVEDLFSGSKKPLQLEFSSPLITCPVLLEKDKFILLLSSLIDTVLSYTSSRRIQISYRLITGAQLIFYLKASQLFLTEEQRYRFMQACTSETEWGTKLLETINGSIGVEFTGESKVTFWFTIPYTPVPD